MKFEIQSGTMERKELCSKGVINKFSEKELDWISNDIIPLIVDFYIDHFELKDCNFGIDDSNVLVPIWLCFEEFAFLDEIEIIQNSKFDQYSSNKVCIDAVKKGLLLDASLFLMDRKVAEFDISKYLEMTDCESDKSKLIEIKTEIEEKKSRIDYDSMKTVNCGFYENLYAVIFIDIMNKELKSCDCVGTIAHEMFHALHYENIKHFQPQYDYDMYRNNDCVHHITEFLAEYFAICFIAEAYLKLPEFDNVSYAEKEERINNIKGMHTNYMLQINGKIDGYNAARYLYEKNENKFGKLNNEYVQIFRKSTIEGNWEEAYEILEPMVMSQVDFEEQLDLGYDENDFLEYNPDEFTLTFEDVDED